MHIAIRMIVHHLGTWLSLLAAGCTVAGPVSLRPQLSLLVAVLDSSIGSTTGTRRCDELEARLQREVANLTGALRVIVLRTGGKNGSPITLADTLYQSQRSGFAVHGAAETRKETFVKETAAACRAGWMVEQTTALRPAVQAAADNATSAEVEATRGGADLATTLFIASDLREEIEPVWRRAVRLASERNLEDLDGIRIVVPSSVTGIEVCGIAETRDRIASGAERENVKIAFRRLVSAQASFAGTCPRTSSSPIAEAE